MRFTRYKILIDHFDVCLNEVLNFHLEGKRKAYDVVDRAPTSGRTSDFTWIRDIINCIPRESSAVTYWPTWVLISVYNASYRIYVPMHRARAANARFTISVELKPKVVVPFSNNPTKISFDIEQFRVFCSRKDYRTDEISIDESGISRWREDTGESERPGSFIEYR